MYLCFPPACPELFSQLKCVRRNYERTLFCKRASSRLYCKGARFVLSPKHRLSAVRKSLRASLKCNPVLGNPLRDLLQIYMMPSPPFICPGGGFRNAMQAAVPQTLQNRTPCLFPHQTLCLNFGTALFLKSPWEGGFASNIQQARKISSEIGSIVINASLKTGPTGISDCPAGCLQPLSQNC